MHLDLAVIFSQVQLLLRAQVLIPEEYYATLRNQQCQLVLLLVRQILELQTDNLSTDMCSQVLDFLGRGE